MNRKRKIVRYSAQICSEFDPDAYLQSSLQPGSNPAALVQPLDPNRRSPTPPTRVVKSTYGGNLFTEEDVNYLMAYIQYCKDIGQMLR
jgi:hypothetical protein